MVVLGDRKAGEITADALRMAFHPTDVSVASFVDTGAGAKELAVGGIFRDYTGAGGSVAAHIAVFDLRGMNRTFLFSAFHYAFEQLKVAQVLAPVESTNTKSLEFVRKVGFKLVARIPDAFPDGDMVIHTIVRDQCRWLNYASMLQTGGSDRQTISPAAA